ncbi:MAG: hypothetical protein ACOC5A_05685 [Halanaerobiales bacterium]
MREVSFQEYDKKRKQFKIEQLKLRDELEKKMKNTNAKNNFLKRDKEKRSVLYRLAKNRHEKLFEKIGSRKYKVREKEEVPYE